MIFHRFWYVYQLSKFGDRISKLVRLPNSNDSLWLAAMAYITIVFMGVMFTIFDGFTIWFTMPLWFNMGLLWLFMWFYKSDNKIILGY